MAVTLRFVVLFVVMSGIQCQIMMDAVVKPAVAPDQASLLDRAAGVSATGIIDSLLEGGAPPGPRTPRGPPTNVIDSLLAGGDPSDARTPRGPPTNVIDSLLGGGDPSRPRAARGPPTDVTDTLLGGGGPRGPPDGTLGGLLGDLVQDMALSKEQRRLNERCRRKCKTELCYLADPDDCRNFIVCTQRAREPRQYAATVQKCAFGTFWGGFQRQQKVTCDLPSNVNCNIEYCKGKAVGENFDHIDGNCKTYWECGEKGVSIPKCCHYGHRYDYQLKKCVNDTDSSCHDACPIKTDVCLGYQQLTDYFDDGNCKTYWECEEHTPHPVCCPDGQGYDRKLGTCVVMPGCKSKCPKQYEPDICLTKETYTLLDNNCQTFMKCNSIDGDERWCCPSNHVFDEGSLSCVERTADMNLSCVPDHCPANYKQVCHLQPSANASFYIVEIHNRLYERPCAPGTLFDVNKCTCAVKVKNAPDNSCTMELDIDFGAQNWIRSGSQRATKIIQIGKINEGPKLNSKSSYKFDGDLYFRTPFFRSDYANLYINVIYQTGPSNNGKQILLSNCMTRDLQSPSLELYLENGQIYLALITNNVINAQLNGQVLPVIASVPYTTNVWNKFTAIYDGQNVYVLNEGGDAPAFDKQSLTGVVVIAAEGLDIGGCWVTRNQGGFRGSVSKLQFSKCLRQEWIDSFNEIATPA